MQQHTRNVKSSYKKLFVQKVYLHFFKIYLQPICIYDKKKLF